MSVQEIESAIAQLPLTDVAEIAQWIERFQSETGSQVSRDTAGIKVRLRSLVKETEVERWLSAPNALLGGVSPQEAIARGQASRVSEILVRLEEGIYV